MTLFLQLVAAATKLAEIANDPTTLALIAKLKEWFQSLPVWQQLAFASKFEAFQGYGCPHGDDCPDCPEDVKPIVEALIEASKAGQ